MSDNTYSNLHFFDRHTSVSRYPVVEINLKNWIPACAGMTVSLPSSNSEQKPNNNWKTRIMLKIVLISALLLPITQPCAQQLIAVMDLAAEGSVSKNLMDSLCNRISEEITRNQQYIAFERQFIPFTLEQAGIKLSLPCADNRCLSEAGKLLGAKYIIGGSLQLSKNKLEIDLNRVDIETGKSVQTARCESKGTINDFFNDKLPDIVQNLMSNRGPGTKTMANKSTSNHLLMRIGMSALAVAGGGAAVYFYNKKGQTAANGDLPIDDAPVHVP